MRIADIRLLADPHLAGKPAPLCHGVDIAPACNAMRSIAGRPGPWARWRPRHAFRFPPRDSKRVGKFAANAGARRKALDMYPRERRKPADAAKSPARFERNARRMA